jgi:hypothetical protein
MKYPVSYILKDGVPVPEHNPRVLDAFLRDIDKRRVGEASFNAPDGTEIRVSTVLYLC